MTDLVLAIVHHILVFALAGLLAAEMALVRPGLGGASLSRLSRIDGLYGGVSVAVILVGAARVVFGIRGWEYYVYYPVFWLKMASFLAVGLISIAPTMRIISWNRAKASDAAFSPPTSEIDRVRRYFWLECAGIAAILVFAAAMARGVGY